MGNDEFEVHCQFDNPKSIRKRIEQGGADIVTENVIIKTIKNRNINDLKKIIPIYIEKGIDINKGLGDSKRTMLHLAIRHLYTPSDIILFFVENKADLSTKDADGKTPLVYAIGKSNDMDTTVKLLVQNGATVNDSELLAACQCDNKEVLNLLLTKHPNPTEVKTRNNGSLLHAAASKDANITLRELLKFSTLDINLQNDDGDTPLLKAALHKSGYALGEIIYNDSTNLNVNLQNKDKKTALHYIIAKGDSVTNESNHIKRLMELRADPCIQDNDGNTPLHILIQKQPSALKEDIVKERIRILLKSLDIVNIKNNAGVTPLQLAQNHPCEYIKGVITDYLETEKQKGIQAATNNPRCDLEISATNSPATPKNSQPKKTLTTDSRQTILCPTHHATNLLQNAVKKAFSRTYDVNFNNSPTTVVRKKPSQHNSTDWQLDNSKTHTNCIALKKTAYTKSNVPTNTQPEKAQREEKSLIATTHEDKVVLCGTGGNVSKDIGKIAAAVTLPSDSLKVYTINANTHEEACEFIIGLVSGGLELNHLYLSIANSEPVTFDSFKQLLASNARVEFEAKLTPPQKRLKS